MAPEFTADRLTLLCKKIQSNVLLIVFGAASHFNEPGVMP
jgi:hypothetical protein